MTHQQDFIEEFRLITGYEDTVLEDHEIGSLMSRAETRIRREKSLDQETEVTSSTAGEDALFWWTCLFAKVSTGELDSQDLQVGALSQDQLLAREDDEVTVWARNAQQALRALEPGRVYQVASPQRDRQYEAGNYQTRDTGGSGGSTEVDASDL